MTGHRISGGTLLRALEDSRILVSGSRSCSEDEDCYRFDDRVPDSRSRHSEEADDDDDLATLMIGDQMKPRGTDENWRAAVDWGPDI